MANSKRLSWTKQSWSKDIGYWIADITESNVNKSNNTSDVTINFYIKTPSAGNKSETYNNTNNTSAYISIDGTQVSSKSPAKFDIRYKPGAYTARNATISILSVTKTIKHNSDGNKTISITCAHDCGSTTPRVVTLSGNFTLSNSKPAPAPPPPPPPPAPTPQPARTYWCSLRIQAGTHNLGNNVQMTLDGWTSYGEALNHKIWFQLENNSH